jgi:DNA-binding LytR/AlgR family response regulator
MKNPTALIAEDEPLLAGTLRKQLRDAWPELTIVAEASDGETAIVRALDELPDVLFLDIRMPGRTGLAVAEAVVDDWPDDRSAPLIVFVTAYDEFAIAAFEREAVDYVQKPVTPERIVRTVTRVQARLRQRAVTPDASALARLVASLQAAGGLAAGEKCAGDRLDVVHVGRGDTVEMVPVTEVVYFEATDKYVTVHARGRAGLIRTSMRELAARLDPQAFMQVHRAVIVNRAQIVAAVRDDEGHVELRLRDSPNTIAVSRAFAHRFRAM